MRLDTYQPVPNTNYNKKVPTVPCTIQVSIGPLRKIGTYCLYGKYRTVWYLKSVLWIRIRTNSNLFAGSGYGSGIINF